MGNKLEKANQSVGNSFSILLGISFVLGLALPGVDRIPSYVLAIILGVQIFFSSFKVALREIEHIRPQRVFLFYAARYLVFPIILFLLLRLLHAPYLIAIFLLSLMPAGVSSPAFTSILLGNVSLSLIMLVGSSLLAPFVVPFAFELFVSRSITINTMGLFASLVYVIFVPLLLHIPVRKIEPAADWIRRNNSLLVVPLVGCSTVIGVSKIRQFMFSNVQEIFLLFIISFACYVIYYAAAWRLARSEIAENRIAFSLCSGAANVSLGLVVSLLHFSTEITAFMVLAHPSWVAALIGFKWWLKRTEQMPANELVTAK